jgi:hypothetical protein
MRPSASNLGRRCRPRHRNRTIPCKRRRQGRCTCTLAFRDSSMSCRPIDHTYQLYARVGDMVNLPAMMVGRNLLVLSDERSTMLRGGRGSRYTYRLTVEYIPQCCTTCTKSHTCLCHLCVQLPPVSLQPRLSLGVWRRRPSKARRAWYRLRWESSLAMAPMSSWVVQPQ